MSDVMNRIALNRQTAPHLELFDFLKLAHDLGFKFIELRCDIAPHYHAFDNHSVERVLMWLEDFNLTVLTINALGQCNDIKNIIQLEKNLMVLCEQAQMINCKQLVLCPSCDPNLLPFEETQSTLNAQTELSLIEHIAPILEKFRLVGLFEPLGFYYSTFRNPYLGQAIVNQQPNTLGSVFDTFHFYLFNKLNNEFNHIQHANLDFSLESLNEQFKSLLPNLRLVHLSSVHPDLLDESLSDNDRCLLSQTDKLCSINQVKVLESLGYHGMYSFEPFSDTYTLHSIDELKNAITESLAILVKYISKN